MNSRLLNNDTMGPDQYRSRSQKKRESTALQKHGEELAALSPELRKTLPISAELAQALNDYDSMRSHEARRRHMQYIGRLMREAEELDTLLNALDALKMNTHSRTRGFHDIEQLRDELIAKDDVQRREALQEAMRRMPDLESARIRHLVEAALADRAKKRSPKHSRKLFRLLMAASQEQTKESHTCDNIS